MRFVTWESSLGVLSAAAFVVVWGLPVIELIFEVPLYPMDIKLYVYLLIFLPWSLSGASWWIALRRHGGEDGWPVESRIGRVIFAAHSGLVVVPLLYVLI